MKLQPLDQFRHAIKIGQPLPFSICDEGGRLLLARGRVLESTEQLEGLLERGAFIDSAVDDLQDDPCDKIAHARPQDLPALWDRAFDHIGRVLRASVNTEFVQSLESASKPLSALIAKDPDLAILQVVRQDEGTVSQYASRRAVHAAIAACLAARRLGWGTEVAQRGFRAALTMNLSMAELQNRLASQITPLTPLQREGIRSHPERSVELLQEAGVTDRDWLQAVERHHEHENGQGYPKGLTEVDELASLLQRSDVFTAKLSPRNNRGAIAPDQAARRLYVESQGHPMVAALIKEFGLYPPGASVQLASGETGVVMRRGETANTPLVVVVTNRNGDLLMQPQRRDTAQKPFAITKVMTLAQQKFRISIDRLTQYAHT